MLRTEDEIGQVRSLGPTRLRWSPGRSRLPEAMPVDGRASADQVLATSPAVALANTQHRYDAVARACQQISQLLAEQPLQAAQVAKAATESLLDGMLTGGEICLRALPDGAGDHDSLHALNVSVVSMLLGHVFGFGRAELGDLGLGALLHDIGKLDLPLPLRHLRGDLSQAEFATYRSHVVAGVAQAGRMGLNAAVTAVLAQHHEMSDGSGFPERRSADRMSTAARIVAMVNSYDSLCNPRDPNAVLTPHEAMSRMFAQSQSKFDMSMVNALIRLLGVYPPGSLVQLTDDRFALVHSVNTGRPMKPRVVVADPAQPDGPASLLHLDSCVDLGIRRSIRCAQVPARQLSQLSPRARIAYFFEPAPQLPLPTPG